MVRSLRVSKVHHPVDLTFDQEGLRIEGDFNAGKQGNNEGLYFFLHKDLLNKLLQ
jgi:sphingosine kinase